MESYLHLARCLKRTQQNDVNESEPTKSPEIAEVLNEGATQDKETSTVRSTGAADMSRPNGHTGDMNAEKETPDGKQSRLDSESDTDSVLDTTVVPLDYDKTGKQAYEKACTQLHLAPCTKFSRKLESATSINLSHYGTGPQGAATIAVPLMVNTHVTCLNLRGNGISTDGMAHICRMMTENTSVTALNLSENNLRSAGARLIAQMLALNATLTTLDISDNNLNDNDAEILAKAIEGHNHLTDLNLSNNNFGVKAGGAFKNMIAENGMLRTLDMSWNQIRLRGATDLAKGLQENIGLKSMNISWNGFGDEGAVAVAAALRTCPLVELDMSSNRIGTQGFLTLCQALPTNEDLKTLKLGRNPVTEQTAMMVLEFFKTSPHLSINTFDLSGTLYSKGFERYVQEVCDVHRTFACPYGYTDSYGKRRMKQYNVVEEALESMTQYCVQKNINIVELFSRFDSDGSMSVTHEEFKLGLREARIPLSDNQIEELIKALDQDGDGEIDFSEMVLGAHQYRTEDENAKIDETS